MQITTITFFLFVCGVLVAYFLTPKKWQWITLLAASCTFYLFCGWTYFLFVIFTSVTIFAGTIHIKRINEAQKVYFKENKLTREEKKSQKEINTKRKKQTMVSVLLLNIFILCFFKYLNFTIEQLNHILTHFDMSLPMMQFIAPLGISFYTFQMIGYLVDVYWGNVEAEENYFKVLLFCSFFPQMTQGPISEYDKLAPQLFEGHDYSYKNYSYGMQRMVWGFFKKMVIADALAVYVNNTFANYPIYSGVTTLIGAFFYSAQIYADFSGYMDIMCGLCEIMGIHLTENFDRPYFSKSVAEYWRRWHMSLGTWFKKYIYYPVSLAKWNRKLGKKSRDRFGKTFGDMIPPSVALIIVWLATGLWHGASWAYIVWGLVNGLFIILTLWLESFYESCRKVFHMDDTTKWKVFRILRTFVLITFIKVLPEVGTLSDGLGLWKHIFTNHEIPKNTNELFSFVVWQSGYNKVQFALAMLGILLMFIVSFIQRKKRIRLYTEKWPMLLRVAVFSIMSMLILSYGIQNSVTGGGFMYAQF